MRPQIALASVLILVGVVTTAYAAERVVVAFGDSLTAGLGVMPDEAYPARLEKRLQREGFAYRVVNAGVSGDTTAGALRRVDWALRARPEVVIVALGANDGLRGVSPATTRDNLAAIVARFQAAGARVLLAGMRLAPNYGESLGRQFAAVFPAVARRAGVPLVPFLLDGVAAEPRLNQADGIHPNANGHRIIADRLWPHLAPLLRRDGRAVNRRPATPVSESAGDSEREQKSPMARRSSAPGVPVRSPPALGAISGRAAR